MFKEYVCSFDWFIYTWVTILGIFFCMSSAGCGFGADAVSMWAVPAEQRPSSQALLVITMHLCGDVPAPPLVGALQGTPSLGSPQPLLPKVSLPASFSANACLLLCRLLKSLAVCRQSLCW